MKCQYCGNVSDKITAVCPICNKNYSLGSALEWIINVKGEDVLEDPRSLKAFISDLCRDTGYDAVVFDGLLNQGFAKNVKALHKTQKFEEYLDVYCNKLSTTYNIEKINYIADSFYYAYTGKNKVRAVPIRPDPTQKIVNTQTPNTQKQIPQVPNTPSQNPTPSLDNLQDVLTTAVNKIQKTDFSKIFSSINIKNIKNKAMKNKKITFLILGCIALIMVLSIVSSVFNGISKNKDEENYQNADSGYSDSYEDEEKDSPTYDLLKKDSVSDVVYQGTAREYHIKADNPGIYRFTANERTANYNIYLNVYDMNGNRVLNSTNEGSCFLESGGTYRIVAETDSESCSFRLDINRPNEVKTLSMETPVINDSITYIDQCNVYTFSAPISGRYRVDCFDRTDGYNLQIEVYNSNNDRVFNETNGGYLDMEQGVVYSVNVRYSTGFCNYNLKISIPNAPREIAVQETIIEDSFTFANQINIYNYTAPISGRYRFETKNRTNGYNVHLRIYDANDNRIVRETNDGTVDMEKGVKYRIEIEHDTELCSYNLVIGVPHEIRNIADGEFVADTISYVHQVNRYTFTPGFSGEYKIVANGRTNDYNVEVYMYDANGNRVLREYNEGVTTLTAGTLYTIDVCYIDNLCDYNLIVSPNE